MTKITMPLSPDLADKFHDLCDHYRLPKNRCAQLLIYKYNGQRLQATINYSNLYTRLRGVEHLKNAHGVNTDEKILMALGSEAYRDFFSTQPISDTEALFTMAEVFDISDANELYLLLLTRANHSEKEIARSSHFVHFSTRAQTFSISGTLRAAIAKEHTNLLQEGVTP